jgi:hypothetical protein
LFPDRLRADIAGRSNSGVIQTNTAQVCTARKSKAGEQSWNDAMNLKNHNYMKGAEFKTRQFWLPFVDAVGVALQVMADVKEQTADWFKAWVKRFRTSRKVTLRYLGMEVDDALAIAEQTELLL